MGRIPVTYINQHVNVFQNLRILPNLLKGEEYYLIGCAGQRFNHAGIAVILLLVEGMMHHMAAPGTHTSPAVQNSHLFIAEALRAFDVLIQLPEFVTHAFHIIDKLRKLASQL